MKVQGKDLPFGRALLLLQRSGLTTALAVPSFVTLLFLADGGAPPAPLLTFVAALTAGAYGIDRLTDHAPSRWARFASFLVVGTVLCLAVLAALSLPGRRLLFIGGAIVASVIAYSFPLLPGQRRVKDVPFVKAFYVGLAWAALLVACLPQWSTRSGFVLVLIYTRVVMGSIASDVKDVDEDRARQVITFPVRYGRDVILRRLQQGHAVLALVYVVAVMSASVPWPVLLGGADAMLAALSLRSISTWRPEKIGLGTDLLMEATASIPLLRLLF